MKNKNLTLVLMFIFLLILSFLFIYTGDDWAWGSQIGIDRLHTFFHNYNSRYLGNIVVIILTRSNLLKTLSIAITSFSIIFLISKIVNPKRLDLLLLSFLLFLLTPKLIFREAISWTSGFANYTTSTLLVLIYLYYLKNIQTTKLKNDITLSTFFLFLLGLSTNLFIEHLTIYNLILSIFIIIYYYYKYHEFNKNLFAHLIGSLSGFIIMFTNLTTTTGERNIASNFIDTFMKICNNYFGIMYEELIYHNLILNFIFIILIFILMRHQKITKLQKVSFGISLSYVIYSLLNAIKNLNLFSTYTPHFEGIFTFIFALTTAFLLISLTSNKLLKQRLIFYLISIILIVSPLLFVSPIGSRCFFITYIFFSISIIELVNYLLPQKIIIKKLNTLYLLLIPIICLRLLFIYSNIYYENKVRLNSINDQIAHGQNIITISRFTYEDYIHGTGTPTPNTIWMDRYQLFYHIDQQIKIEIAD